ncbi:MULTISPECIES: hypothetical protein [Rubripirellula]|nr:MULTISPECIES: hypothetical protein [Rubripirellula]
MTTATPVHVLVIGIYERALVEHRAVVATPPQFSERWFTRQAIGR